MRTTGGVGFVAELHCYSSARRLLGGGAVAPAEALPAYYSPPSIGAHRVRLERALCATAAVLFVASVSYVALSSLFACLRAARRPHRQQPDAEPEATKRALEEIPVVVVVVAQKLGHDSDSEGGRRSRDKGGGGGGGGGGVDAVTARGDDGEICAVCLAEYTGGEEVRVLPACRHGFHRECVDRWLLTRAPTCPVCRAPVVAANSDGRDNNAKVPVVSS